MGSAKQQVIGVVGTPGAWTNIMAQCLEGRGCQILWPGQTLLPADDESLYTHNGENPEVMRIHDLILEECAQNRYSTSLPSFFSFPFPGPEHFLAKFSPSRPVVIADPFVCLVWGMWRSYITDVVIVSTEEDVTSHFLRNYIDVNMSDEDCRAVFDFYSLQLQRVADSFVGRRNRLYLTSNAVMKDNRVYELVDSMLKAMDGSHVRQSCNAR